jgi:patatin-related protein
VVSTNDPPRGQAWASTMEEVRLAMAWNGGVSLAIWMGGVAVELDQSRRTIPRASATTATAGSAGSTAALYQALADAFDRRLVIDILAGASAGGLNGALLAGVITHRTTLAAAELRSRWLDIGDFGKLLTSLDAAKPTSVMQGAEFLDQVEKAFEAFLGTKSPPERPNIADQPLPVLLDVQVTNVLGRERVFVDDWGLPFRAIEYRAPVQFREWDQFDAKTLATAARASASFPGAFEPLRISDSLKGSLVVPQTTWAIDGGLLENAPIRQAIELIPQRPASGPVVRYVCYVNAAPSGPKELTEVDQPDLLKVIGYAINLPRDGRVIDQLYSLEDAARRAGITSSVGTELIRLDTSVLLRLATGLLPAYQRRRGTLSLEELLDVRGIGGPGLAQRTIAALARDAGAAGDLARGAASLPWIPAGIGDLINAGAAETCWRFGIRAAQRIVQLELDLLREVLHASTAPQSATAIFEARGSLDDALTKLERERLGFMSPNGEPACQAENLTKDPIRAEALSALGPPAGGSGLEARCWLERATRVFYETLVEVAPDQARALFAPLPNQADAETDPDPDVLETELTGEGFRAFVARALAVEVVRRSFSDDYDIESSQTLHVAQLTPLTESPLFDRGTKSGPRKRPADAPPVDPVPDKELGPTDTREKLAGVRLGHFASFYRRSWRANDFMWGRLDGAAMIARLLIDSDRARARAAVTANQEKPWVGLADALLAEERSNSANRDRMALLEEHLGPQDDMRSALLEALENDLTRGKGELTRSLVARALQYQILREELPSLVDSAKQDQAAGSSPSSVRKWNASGSLSDTIAKLRAGRGKHSLPALLGADDPNEATSQLALRTLSHTLLVSTAAVGGRLPLARLLQPVRVPVLSILGATARRPLDRIATAVAFTGAAWYVSARLLALITGNTEQSRTAVNWEVPISAVWTSPVLAYWISILAVVGFAAVPILRAARAVKGRDWARIFVQGAWALALILSAGLILFVEAIRRTSTSEALTTWSAPNFAPKAALLLVVAAGAFQIASISSVLVRGVALSQRLVRRWIAVTSAIYAAIAVWLAYSVVNKHGFPHSWPSDSWGRVAVVTALAAPLLALIYVRCWAGWNRQGQ